MNDLSVRGRSFYSVALPLLLFVSLAAVGCGGADGGEAPAYPRDDELRLNQIQVIGSHNSYHIEPRPALLTALVRAVGSLAYGFAYTHRPLDEQFETQGVRQIEIDVFADPEGGKFAKRMGMRLIHEPVESGVPELERPGFKVLHVQDLDFESTCWTLIDCLQTVKRWSDAHSKHMPIMILIEAKDEIIPIAGSAIPLPFDKAQFDALDAEIRSVFPASQLITPDDVRGEHETLEEAVTTAGWPTLRQSRGRILFCLDNGGDYKQAYLDGHPSLRGRVMFTSSGPGEPEAAFIKLNSSIDDFALIQAAVAQGFVVRTRADGDTVEAQTGDTVPRDKALESGAQWISTDYPVPDPRWSTGYSATIPGGLPARCNPITAPPDCKPSDIENPEHLVD